MTTCSRPATASGVRGLLVLALGCLVGACGDSGGGVPTDSARPPSSDGAVPNDSLRPPSDAGACQPYCAFIGTAEEGWYDGCDHQLLINPRGSEPLVGPCAGCDVTCKEIGSKSEGWWTSCKTPYYGLLKYSKCAWAK